MKHLIPLIFLVISTAAAPAAPVISLEVSGVPRSSGAILRLASDGVVQVTDPIAFTEPTEPITVSFPNVVPGDYYGQVSFDGEIYSDATSLIAHPAAGTLSFTHDPGAVVNVSYRLLRVIEDCAEITIRNTGDMPLTGIAANLTGSDFSPGTTAMATSLNPGETTTVTVCVTATDQNEHLDSLEITGNAAPFTLALVGDNAPGPIQQAPSYRLMGNTWDHPSGKERLCFVDTTTGAATPVSATETSNLMGIAWDASRQTLYGTTTHVSSPKSKLVTIDRMSGETIANYSIGLEGLDSVPEGDVAVQTSTGLIFCLVSGGRIQIWNPVSETVERSMPLGPPGAIDDYSALAFNQSGALYMVDPNSLESDPDGTSMLHRIDPLTGGILDSIELSEDLGVVMGLAFHPDTDEAFIADSCDAGAETSVGPDRCDGYHLYRLDVGTGQLTELGLTSEGFGLSGLTFVPEFVPLDPAPELRVVGPVGEVSNGQAGVFQFDANSFGGGSSHSYQIHNDGVLDPLIFSGVTLPPGFTTTLSGFPLSIEPGQAVTLTISNIGPSQGVYEGDVVLTTNDADEASFSFPIRALFNMPEIVVGGGLFGSTELVNGGTLDLGSIRLGETRNTTLRVTNLHAGTLTVSGLSLPAGYAVSPFSQSLPFSLGRNQSRDLVIDRISTTAGTFSGTLSILNNDFDEGPFDIQLTGTVSPESIQFFGFSTSINEGGQVSAFASGIGPVTYAWDLDDDGEFDDATESTVSLPDSDGPDTFLAQVRMTDNLTTMIRAESIPVNNRVPFINGGLQQSVIAGTPLELSFSASDAPADVAAGMTWRIDWGDGDETTTPAGHQATTMFSHTFDQPGPAGITIEATDKDGGKGSTFRSVWVHSAVIGVFDGSDTSGTELRDGESSLTFSVPAGESVDRSLTVLNRSANPASVGPVSLPEGYVLVAPLTFPATIASGATLTLTLRFAPPSGGDFNGTFALSTSDTAMPVFEISLSGFSAAPDIAVSEFSSERFDFESGTQSFDVFPGTQEFDGQSIHIENTTFQAPLMIQSIELPPGFQLASPPTFPINFPSDTSINIRIQCSATENGFYKGWVSIVSNDPDESPFRFFVTSRIGDVADLRVSSVSDDSSSAEGLLVNGQGGSPELPLQLWLSNRGSLDMTVSNVSLPPGFAFVSPPSFPILLNFFGSTALPEIVLTATEPGTYSGQVVITSTDPDENPFSFSISATIPGGGGPALSVSDPVIRPAGPGVLAGVSGTIVGGQPNGTAFVEASVDLGQLDTWRVIATVPLDENGEGVFGDPVPVEDAQSTGSDTWFVRVRQ